MQRNFCLMSSEDRDSAAKHPVPAGLPRAHRREAHLNRYDDFPPGRRFDHHWGRTITADEATSFAAQHVIHEPLRFNQIYARHLGYPDLVVSPILVYAIVLGLSVEDLSESGGPFLGSDQVRFLAPVYPGDTLFASSVVLSRRDSGSKKDFGIVEWETSGCNQNGEPVIVFRRANLVRR
jgi:acyl dehydratase